MWTWSKWSYWLVVRLVWLDFNYLTLLNLNIIACFFIQRNWYEQSSRHTCWPTGSVGDHSNTNLRSCWNDTGSITFIFLWLYFKDVKCYVFWYVQHTCYLPVQQILAIRAQVEELVVDDESLAFLGDIGQRTSLRSAYSRLSVLLSYTFPYVSYTCCLLTRHAVQLLSPASIVAKMNGRDNICKVIMKLNYLISAFEIMFTTCLSSTLWIIIIIVKFIGGSWRGLFIIFGCQIICQITSRAAGEIHFVILLFSNCCKSWWLGFNYNRFACCFSAVPCMIRDHWFIEFIWVLLMVAETWDKKTSHWIRVKGLKCAVIFCWNCFEIISYVSTTETERQHGM